MIEIEIKIVFFFCYTEKISLITTAFETFAVLTLICQLNVDADFTAILVITQTENSTITHNITATCNATVIVNSLTESTNYTVTTVHKSTSYPNPQIHKCSLDHFRTSQPGEFNSICSQMNLSVPLSCSSNSHSCNYSCYHSYN